MTDCFIIGDSLALLAGARLIELDDLDTRYAEMLTDRARIRDTCNIFSMWIEEIAEKARIRVGHPFLLLERLTGFTLADFRKESHSGILSLRPFFGAPDRHSSLRSNVFVLMPFDAELKPVYEDHIVNTCKGLGLTCKRADDFFRASRIMQDVWSAIFMADWIIADCTGRNPNVFYEMGIAHTMGKKMILITQREEDVPFDIRYIRYLKYDYNPRGMKALEQALTNALTTM